MLRDFESAPLIRAAALIKPQSAETRGRHALATFRTDIPYTEAICDWCGEKEALDRNEGEPFEPFQSLRNWVMARITIKRGDKRVTAGRHFCCRKCRDDYGRRIDVTVVVEYHEVGD